MSPIEWDRCEKNHIAALHCKNHHFFPSTLPSGIPLAPPAWTPIPQPPFSHSMQQLAPIHHNSAGYCSIPSPSGTPMQFLSTHFYPENVAASYQNTTGVVKYVQGSETRKPLSNISSTLVQQGCPDDVLQSATKKGPTNLPVKSDPSTTCQPVKSQSSHDKNLQSK